MNITIIKKLDIAELRKLFDIPENADVDIFPSDWSDGSVVQVSVKYSWEEDEGAARQAIIAACAVPPFESPLSCCGGVWQDSLRRFIHTTECATYWPAGEVRAVRDD